MPSHPPPPVLDRFLQYLLYARGLSSNTLTAYQHDLENWLHWLEHTHHTPPNQASNEQVLAYLSQLQTNGQADSSIRRVLSSLRGFYRYLKQQEEINHSPCAHIAHGRQSRPIPLSLSEQEVERLLQAPKTHTTTGLRDRCMLEILYACGLRISELIQLRREHLNPNLGLFRILGKGNKERLLPVGDEALFWLQQYQQRLSTANHYLFPSLRNSGPITRQTCWHRIKAYCQQCDIDARVSPHTLRHAFATHLLNHGADLRSVQCLLGHSNISTTQIYTHVAMQRLQDLHQHHHPRG